MSSSDAARKRAYRRRLRLRVLSIYGSRCLGCGTRDELVLTLDHIHCDGHAERRLNRTRSNERAYRNVALRPSSRWRYQLLCCNCQLRKVKLGLTSITRNAFRGR